MFRLPSKRIAILAHVRREKSYNLDGYSHEIIRKSTKKEDKKRQLTTASTWQRYFTILARAAVIP
jgi:hypothetical protein